MKNVLLIFIFLLFLQGCKQYFENDGPIQGTTYHIKYKAKENIHTEILDLLHQIDKSLSIYDSTSLISKINRNDTTIVADEFFNEVYRKAYEVSEISGGAFDITVGPLVNAWGFGFKKMQSVDSALIDSLLPYIGYRKVSLLKGKILKENPGIMLDVNAIAQGYSVDKVASLLERQGIRNYMIEIGGEVRVKGKNPDGILWRVGIDKPIEDTTGEFCELETIVNIHNRSVATSGNYRKFYMKNGIKYSHTINPHTGFPAHSNLLSASVFTSDCMTADAFATTFMVLGLDKSWELIQALPYLEAYFIYSDTLGNMQVKYTSGVEEMIEK